MWTDTPFAPEKVGAEKKTVFGETGTGKDRGERTSEASNNKKIQFSKKESKKEEFSPQLVFSSRRQFEDKEVIVYFLSWRLRTSAEQTLKTSKTSHQSVLVELERRRKERKEEVWVGTQTNERTVPVKKEKLWGFFVAVVALGVIFQRHVTDQRRKILVERNPTLSPARFEGGS